MKSRTVGTFAPCPRCRGQVFREYDLLAGWDRVCLQCGYRCGIVVASKSGAVVARWVQQTEVRNGSKGGNR